VRKEKKRVREENVRLLSKTLLMGEGKKKRGEKDHSISWHCEKRKGLRKRESVTIVWKKERERGGKIKHASLRGRGGEEEKNVN